MATRKRKKRRTKKAAAPRKSSPRAKRAPVDHTKDPVYKLKPNDIIEYTPYGGDGSEFPKEFHIIIEHTYERDPDRISSQPTLQLKDGRLIASTLYCWGDDACDITKLTDTHRLEMIIEDGQVSYKIVKKRKKRKAA